MRMKLLLLLRCLCVLVLLPQLSFAQEHTNFHPVAILVTDPTGAVVANAQIKIEPTTNGAKRSLQTGREGTIKVLLAPGTYQVSVVAIGLSPSPQTIYISQQTRHLTVTVQPRPSCEIVSGGSHEMISLEPVRSNAKLPQTPRSPSRVPVVLRIKVVDLTGAFVPHARYELLSQGTGLCGEVGPDGKFALTVPAGKYHLHVTSQGFRVWKQKVNLQDDEQEVTATLYVASGGGPVVVPEPVVSPKAK